MRTYATCSIGWAWGGFAFCWAALALWLLYAVRSRRRYRTAAHDRQRAVEAMEQGIVAKRRLQAFVEGLQLDRLIKGHCRYIVNRDGDNPNAAMRVLGLAGLEQQRPPGQDGR